VSALALLLGEGCALRPGPSGAALARVPGFVKGQTHAHSNRSGDSATPPAEVLRWYAARGYDFVVLTDHNHATAVPAGEDVGGVLAIRGAELTQNLRTCEPPPERGLSCLLHVNALFLPERMAGSVGVRHDDGGPRLEIFRRAVRATLAQGALAQINHPNFHYAADAAVLATLAREGAQLLEIANEAVDSNNGGDQRHPGTEALWDAVLSTGATIWGVATDDAHHYDDAAAVRAAGEPAFTGDRGFVMVHARKEAAEIRAALVRGDFYASNGVLLARAGRTPDGALEVEVAPSAPGPHRLTCIGDGGRVLAERSGRAGRCAPPPAGGYVRAVVSDSEGRRAWLQPSRIR
jgi:hypothetical protein